MNHPPSSRVRFRKEHGVIREGELATIMENDGKYVVLSLDDHGSCERECLEGLIQFCHEAFEGGEAEMHILLDELLELVTPASAPH